MMQASASPPTLAIAASPTFIVWIQPFIPAHGPALNARSRFWPCRFHLRKRPILGTATSRPPITKRLADGSITSPRGFKTAAVSAGFKTTSVDDLAVVLTERVDGAIAAGVFTQGVVRAAPVEWSEGVVRKGERVRAIVINSGQANACCGEAGKDFVRRTVALVRKELGGGGVVVMSTGTIGVTPQWRLMEMALPRCLERASTVRGEEAANAILTTDLTPKSIALERLVGGKVVRIAGMAKGSGMIHPNMATMLAVLTCDAEVEPSLWQQMLARATAKSFNMITVDGDTSTNDCVCALASGASDVKVTDPGSTYATELEDMLNMTCIYLAKAIARDGEGATVLTEIQVSGANNDQDGRAVARCIAGSSLLKAAVFGRDPNWGRIASAAGYAGVKFNPSSLSIELGPFLLMERGEPVNFDRKRASLYMADAASGKYLSDENTVVIKVRIGDGPGGGTAWGCDLSYKYVEINAEYCT